jgi:hypothetical protein
VAWIDLKRDIVFCDMLAENPKFHIVSLPLSIKELHDPRSVRDMAIGPQDFFIQHLGIF